MSTLATEDPGRAIENAIERIRLTIRHSTTSTTPGEARAYLEAITVSVETELDTIRRAVEELSGR